MDSRRISADVIIPAFNRVDWLIECLVSVLGQSYSPLRLIVIDDGSTPPLSDCPILAEILRDDRVRLIRSANRGPAAARNLGLARADGDFVLMLDSDDVLERTGLETLVRAAQETDADVAIGGWADFEAATARRHVIVPRQIYGDCYANCAEQMWAIGAVLLRNSGMPRFNEKRMPWEALEFYLDYLAEPRKEVYTGRVVVGCRQHERPDRLTIKYDHFEPYNTGQFFAERKAQLERIGLMNEERILALDKQILSCIHSLLRQGRGREACRLFDKIDRNLMRSGRRQRFGSFAWSSRVFGFAGARAFIAANRILGRA